MHPFAYTISAMFSLEALKQKMYDTRQSIYIWRNIEDCPCGKAISITYSECVSVAAGIQRAMRMCHTVNLWPVRLYNFFFPHSP
jgi:hypothetical protein